MLLYTLSHLYNQRKAQHNLDIEQTNKNQTCQSFFFFYFFCFLLYYMSISILNKSLFSDVTINVLLIVVNF